MKKILTLVMSISLSLSPVLAYASSNYAYSIGTNYGSGDIDTSQDAINAANNFGTAGYTSYYQTAPDYQYMRGDNPSTNKHRMESGVLFFSGHGNSECVAFDYNGLGGDYKTGIYDGTDYDSSTGYKYAGIDSYNLSNTNLIVFAACKTSEGWLDNITNHAQNNGAETTVGWPVSIGASSHSQWLERFTYKLALGNTVKQAADYADGFTYSDSGVKKEDIHGNKSQVITIAGAQSATAEGATMNDLIIDDNSFMSIESNNLEKLIMEDTADRKHVLNFSQTNEIATKPTNTNTNELSLVDNYIKNNIDKKFNLKDYKVIKTKNEEDNNYVLDLIYLHNGAETNKSYTIIVENNVITYLYDNTTVPNEGSIQVSSKEVPEGWEIVSVSEKKLYDLGTKKYYDYQRIEITKDGFYQVIENIGESL